MHLVIQQILTQAAGFIILVILLKKFAWGPLLGVLDERKEKIAGELDSIKQTKDELSGLQVKYEKKLAGIEEEAHEHMRKTIEEAQNVYKEIVEEARDNANKLMAKSQDCIKVEMDMARSQFKEEIALLAIQAASKILGSELDGDKHKALIAQTIDRIEEF